MLCRHRRDDPPRFGPSVQKINRKITNNSGGDRAHRTRKRMHRTLVFSSFLITLALSASAQTERYAGVIGGVATLSADAGSQTTTQGLSLSSYAPANGGALNVFAGAHLHNYFSVQVNYIWNRNNLVLNSSSSSTGTFYRETRSSSQNAGVADFLIYFRRRSSRIRPYLGTGGGITHLTSQRTRLIASGGAPVLPPTTFSYTGPVFRSHVGIDLRLARKFDFRYSFSEMISHNEVSKHLSPPGPRKLANFQNLFGFVVRF
jgi:outer membrane protein with beta-barrel domain